MSQQEIATNQGLAISELIKLAGLEDFLVISISIDAEDKELPVVTAEFYLPEKASHETDKEIDFFKKAKNMGCVKASKSVKVGDSDVVTEMNFKEVSE